jgi:hypothetical protein
VTTKKKSLNILLFHRKLDSMTMFARAKTEREKQIIKQTVENLRKNNINSLYSPDENIGAVFYNPEAGVKISINSSNSNQLTSKLTKELLSLPDHLRKTYFQSIKLDRVTADDVAEQTKRARAVESNYLNQLVLMGYLSKKRIGRKVYFFKQKKNSPEK